MGCPLTASEIKDLISKLECLQTWQAQLESGVSSLPTCSGYTRGDPKARALAAGSGKPKNLFPAIPPIAQLWKLVKEEGSPFLGNAAIEVESGPGPVPALVEDQASFICLDQKEALQRVHLSYSAGFWARVAVETFVSQISSRGLSEPAKHFIVLRAPGLGGYIRLAHQDHFDRLKDQVGGEGLLCHSFATETELEVFCQGAKISVPPLFEPC